MIIVIEVYGAVVFSVGALAVCKICFFFAVVSFYVVVHWIYNALEVHRQHKLTCYCGLGVFTFSSEARNQGGDKGMHDRFPEGYW